jgi:translocation and assembly module TamB
MKTSTTNHIDSPQKPDTVRRRRWPHYVWMTLLLLVGVVFAATNTRFGRDQVRSFAERTVNGLLQDARLEIGELDGNLLSGVRARDVRLVTASGRDLLRLDEIRSGYRLWPMLRSELFLESVRVEGLYVSASQQADSSWDWAGLMAPSEGESTWTVDIDTLSVNRSHAHAAFRSSQVDSTLFIHELDLAAGGFHLHPETGIRVRRAALSTAFQPPVRPDTVRLSLDATYQDGFVRLDTLNLQSQRSHVTGSGTVNLMALPTLAFQSHERADSPDGTAGESSSFLLRATPLSLSDLAPFVPSLRPEATLQVEVDIVQNGVATRLNGRIEHKGGGRVNADVDWGQEASGSHLAGMVSIDKLDLDRLIAGSLDTTPISGSLDLDVYGTSSDSLSGQVHLAVGAARVNTWMIGESRLDLESEAGDADATLSTSAQGAVLEARLAGRWLDAEPVVDIEGQIEGFDLAAWVESGDLSSMIGASFEGRASGKDLATMMASMAMDIQPSRFGAVDSVAGIVSLSLSGGRLSWKAKSGLDSGSMSSEGQMTVTDTPAIESMRTRLVAIDVAALMSDHALEGTPTRMSALLSGQGTLEDWRSGRGNVHLELDSTRWSDVEMARATGAATWSSGRGSVRLEAMPADTSSIVMDLDIRSRGNRTRIESRELAWRRLAAGSMTSLDILETSLDGTGSLLLELDKRELDETGLSNTVVNRVDLTLRGAASRWGVQQVESFEVTLDGNGDQLQATASGAFALAGSDSQHTGQWQLQAELEDWLSDTINARLDLDFDQLDPAAFAGSSDPGTALSGRARATARVLEGAPDSGTFEFDLTPSLLRKEPVARARIAGSLQDSVVIADASLNVANGLFEGQFEARPFALIPSFSSTGTVNELNLLPLLGRSDLDSDVNLTWKASGSSFDPSEADWNLDITGQTSRLDSLRLENLNLAASWDGQVLDIADFSSRFNSGNLQVNGRINLDPQQSQTYSDLRATWYIGDLNIIERLVGLDRLASKSGMVDVQVFGPAGELEAEMLLSLSDLEVDTWQVSSVEASSWITLDEELLPTSTTANVDIGYVALPTLAVRTSSVQVEQRGEVFSVAGNLMVDTGNRISLASLVNPFAERPWITLRELNLMLGGESFALERPASLVLDRGWQVNRLSLTSGEQSLSLSGGFSDSSGYAARMSLSAFDIAPVGALAGFADLEGRLGGQLFISGPPEAPFIDSQLDLELVEDGQRLAQVLADLQSTPDGLLVDATVAVQDTEDITVHGFLPVFASVGESSEERADRSADLNLSIQTQGGSIRWVSPFLDPTVVTDLEGLATADIQVSGSIDDPRLEGFLNLDNARFRLPEYGVTYRMNQFRSTLQDVTIRVEEATLRSGDGEMDISGSIDFASLTNSSFDLRAELDRFRAVRNDELHTTLSGNLQLTGRTTRPDLAGQLTTQNTSYWLTETAGGDLEQVALSFDDEVMLARNFGYRAVANDTLAAAIWTGLSMNLSIVLERDTWIRQRVNPEMAIELSGRVDLQKDRGQEDLNIYRSIEVVPDRSTIKQFGRNFRIVEGVAMFNGPVEEMVLQVEAEYEVPSRLNPGQPEVVITLRLDGRLDDLEFNLSSDPAMENTDIVSYIATGRPASQSLQFNDSSINNQVLVGVAASQLAGLVEGVASQSLGLDVVSIEQDGLKGTRLTAGKYVTPRLFVGVTQPFSFSGGSNVVVDEERELTLEYKVFEYLLLQLLADASDSPVRVNIAGRYSY